MTKPPHPADRKQYNFRLGAEDAYLRAELQSDAKKPNGYIPRLILLGMLAEKSGFSVAGDTTSPRLAWPASLSKAIGNPVTPYAVASAPSPTPLLVAPAFSPAAVQPPQITAAKTPPWPTPADDEPNEASSNLDHPEVGAIFDSVLVGL